MTTSEKEAKTKWCPDSRVRASHSNGDAPTTVNRHYGMDDSTRCLGSDCMAWRWNGPEAGYCGKAGKP